MDEVVMPPHIAGALTAPTEFGGAGIPKSVSLHIAMGLPRPLGTFNYNAGTDQVTLNWPFADPQLVPWITSVERLIARLDGPNGPTFSLQDPASTLHANPTITAHPLGGAVMGRTTDLKGEVKNYPGLYVVDGALLPGSAGAVNPSLTIAAFAEYCMARILADPSFYS
jgi:cholesterol oxidase